MALHDDDDDRWFDRLAGRESGDAETRALRQVLLDYAREQGETNEFQKKKRQLALAKRLKEENLLEPERRVWRLPPALAAGLAIAVVGGWLWHQVSIQTLPDLSDNFYDHPQPKGPLDHLPVRTVVDLDATLRQWKQLFADHKLPYRITADPTGKVIEVWVGPQPPAALRELLTREQLAPAADGWLRVRVQERAQ